jgi:hypothetical protein
MHGATIKILWRCSLVTYSTELSYSGGKLLHRTVMYRSYNAPLIEYRLHP